MSVIVSMGRAAELARRTPYAIRSALSRGRLQKGDAFVDETVVAGITFESLADYFGWSPSTRDEILIAHGVRKGVNAFLTVRDPSESTRPMTYGDAALRAEIEASYKTGNDE